MGTTNLIFIIGISLIPILIILGLVLYSDRRSSEPISLIIICILSGFFTIALSFLIQKFLLNSISVFSLNQNYNIYMLVKIFLLATAEEFCKLLMLYVFISHSKSFDDIYDGFVYSAIIALSFAAIENLLYVFGETTFEGMISLSIARSFTSIPLHFVCGIIMGHYIALEKFSKTKGNKIKQIIKSLASPVLIHFLYNVFMNYLTKYANNTKIMNISILIFIIIIYIIGFIFVIKTINLNKKFISNKKYPKKYNFLMNKREFKKK